MQSLQTLFAWGDWVWKRPQEEIEFPISETAIVVEEPLEEEWRCAEEPLEEESADEGTGESLSESIGETALPCEYVHLLFELQEKYKRKLWGVFSSETTAQLAKTKVAQSGVPENMLYLCAGELDRLEDVRGV